MANWSVNMMYCKVGQTNNERTTSYYKFNSDEGDQFLLDFEKYVSEQKVCLFGRTMGLGMLIFRKNKQFNKLKAISY